MEDSDADLEDDQIDIDFEEESQINNFMDQVQSLNDLREEHFPAFFTIRSLIMLIDGCL